MSRQLSSDGEGNSDGNRWRGGGAAANQTKATFTLPIFGPSGSPDAVKGITIQIVNFSGGSNSSSATDGTLITTCKNQLETIYATAGVKVTWNSTSNITLPSTSINLDQVGAFSIDPTTSVLNPSTEESALITAVRNVLPVTTANANTVYLVFIGNFTSGDRGESFPDGFNPPTQAKNFAFVAGKSASSINYTLPHEGGHLLLNQTTSDATSGGHYTGSQNLQNLMHNGTSSVLPLTVLDTKRLWDDSSHATQVTKLRTSRFVTP